MDSSDVLVLAFYSVHLVLRVRVLWPRCSIWSLTLSLSFILFSSFGASAALTAMATAVREQELTEVLRAPSFGHVAVKKPRAPRGRSEGASDEAEVRRLLTGHDESEQTVLDRYANPSAVA